MKNIDLENRITRLENAISSHCIKNEATFDEMEYMFNSLNRLQSQYDKFCRDFDNVIYEYSTPSDMNRSTALSIKIDNVKQAMAELRMAIGKIRDRLEINS